MTKERFLTVHWNNMLVLGLGLPALLYVAVVLAAPMMSDRASFIGLAVIGILY